MIKAFDFEDDGRTYTCHVAESRAAGVGAWWWFSVSGDGHRYAPFHALASDTRTSVRSRIVAYYRNRLAHRSMPAAPHWARRGKGATPAPKLD